MSWGNYAPQIEASDEVNGDLEEKAAVEREIARRGVTDYHSPPSVPYQDLHDHCHCQCWVVHL
jgi:hypothetical protein